MAVVREDATGGRTGEAPGSKRAMLVHRQRMAILEHIDEQAAAGPDAVNTEMPIGAPAPTQAERQLLGEWLACGAL